MNLIVLTNIYDQLLLSETTSQTILAKSMPSYFFRKEKSPKRIKIEVIKEIIACSKNNSDVKV